VAAVVLLTMFVVVEAHSADPLVPLSAFQRRNLTGANIVSLAAQAAFFAMFYFLSLYLQNILGFSA